MMACTTSTCGSFCRRIQWLHKGKKTKPSFSTQKETVQAAKATESRRVTLDGALLDVPVFARTDLKAGHHFVSPAIVTQSDCTTCIPAGFKGRVDTYGNLILTQEG